MRALDSALDWLFAAVLRKKAAVPSSGADPLPMQYRAMPANCLSARSPARSSPV